MLAKKLVHLSIPVFLLLGCVSVLPALRAADLPRDSKEIADLLSQAKTQTNQLKQDADDMESFTRSNVSWESHAAKLTEIKEHVNEIGKTVAKLNQAKAMGSPSQKIAIERINPIMAELAMNTEATINHLNREKGSLLNNEEHKEYLKTNAELATKMASVVSDFVDYGETKAKFLELQRKLEISEGSQAGVPRRGSRVKRTSADL